MQRWTDLHNPLHGAGYYLDHEFHSHDHFTCAETLKDHFFMCNKVHGTGSAASGCHQPRPITQLDWSCVYQAKAGILQNETARTDAASRVHLPVHLVPPEACYEMHLAPTWHPGLATEGMRILSHVISASSWTQKSSWTTLSAKLKLVRSQTHPDEDQQQAKP
jgi:hypothetical protein